MNARTVILYLTTTMVVVLLANLISMSFEVVWNTYAVSNPWFALCNVYAISLSASGLIFYAAAGERVKNTSTDSKLKRLKWFAVTTMVVMSVNALGGFFTLTMNTLPEERWLFYCNIGVGEAMFYSVLIPNAMMAGAKASNRVAGFGLIALVIALASWMGLIPNTFEGLWYKVAIGLFISVVFAAFARFATIDRRQSSAVDAAAILVSAIVFALYHVNVYGAQWPMMVAVLVNGGVYALGYVRTRDPLCAAGPHFINNAFARPLIQT